MLSTQRQSLFRVDQVVEIGEFLIFPECRRNAERREAHGLLGASVENLLRAWDGVRSIAQLEI